MLMSKEQRLFIIIHISEVFEVCVNENFTVPAVNTTNREHTHTHTQFVSP